MSTVYAVGFRDRMFLMVYHPKREGWEMPGGSVESGESTEDAIKREYLEESGYEFHPIAKMEMGEVTVFAGEIGKRCEEGERVCRLFESLPCVLAFPEVE